LTTAQTRKRAPSGGATEKRKTARRPATGSTAPTTGGRSKRGKKLVIVESPAKARTVGNILGDDYQVIASVGHVRDLPNYGYGVEDFETFKPKYVVVKDKRRGIDKTEVIDSIAAAAKGAERIYLSTDPDREGEAIAWHIREAAGIPEEKTTRVVFHEITKPAIERAFEEAAQPASQSPDGDHRKGPGRLDMDLVDAQQARRVLDRLIGFPLTWFVQSKVSRGASAGRVQSVALGLIVKREREIQGFLAVEYWSVHALLAKAGREFEAELVKLPASVKGSLKPPFRQNGAAIPTEERANAIVASMQRSAFTVASVKKERRSRSAAPPFTTSTFQQAAVNRLGMSAARAMGFAQELYEGIQGNGLITYMRTDSLNIASEARREARAWASSAYGPEYVPAKEKVYATRAKGAQEAHEAIRPTSVTRTPESLRRMLNADQLRVYTLIWQRFVASQVADAQYDTVTVDIEAKEGATLHGTFRANARHLVFEGHLRVYGVNADDRNSDDEDDSEASLPELVEGEALQRRNVDGRRHQTEPPPRYTEASLVKVLEEEGIGRPSTYATIVQTVLKRDYVAKQGRQLVPQELGFLVHDLLDKYMHEYVDVPFTGKMEEELDQVADGELEYRDVLREFWPKFEAQLEQAKGSAEKQDTPTEIECNVCQQAKLVIKWGRNGKFFACPRYPECTNSLPMGPDGEPLFVAPPKETSFTCPKDGGALVQKHGPYGDYVDCVNREKKKCDFRSGVPIGVACPEEPETGQLVEKQTRRGTFYGCWNYPHCSYTTNSLDPSKMSPARDPEERAKANAKLLERSVRGKAAFAKRLDNQRAKRAS
jgi:DNA topoisomerase I